MVQLAPSDLLGCHVAVKDASGTEIPGDSCAIPFPPLPWRPASPAVVVLVTLPTPLTVNSVLPSGGTDATFDNASSGATVTWNLNTLDSNTQSTLRITTIGMLAPGDAARTVTVQASMTADGIRPGDAVAQKNIQLMP
ncbi:MAG TPA: hypothetical protein VMR54_13245 [Thermoanaerobaculia bacterium]|nr:hypothetical protein [Thermoanaerobaculia bacterium]